MIEVTVWLLLSLGSYSRSTTSLVERFAKLEECNRVAFFLNKGNTAPSHICIQATVLKPSGDVLR